MRESEFVVGGYSLAASERRCSAASLGLYDARQRLVYTEQLQQVMSEDNDSQMQRRAEDRIGQR